MQCGIYHDALLSTDVSYRLSIHLIIGKVMCSVSYYNLISLGTFKSTNETGLFFCHPRLPFTVAWCSKWSIGNSLKMLILCLSDSWNLINLGSSTMACSLISICNHIENADDHTIYASKLSQWICHSHLLNSQGLFSCQALRLNIKLLQGDHNFAK